MLEVNSKTFLMQLFRPDRPHFESIMKTLVVFFICFANVCILI